VRCGLKRQQRIRPVWRASMMPNCPGAVRSIQQQQVQQECSFNDATPFPARCAPQTYSPTVARFMMPRRSPRGAPIHIRAAERQPTRA